MITKEIADHLGVSIKTVEFHKANLHEKINCHGTAALVRYAIRVGLIEP